MTKLGVALGSLCLLAACGGPSAEPPAFDRLATESLAQLEGEVRLPGLRSEVQVLRDEWGVPHIYAQNVDDLFFAQGFVTAQDRLWQMELWRRQHEGRFAEILGPSAFAYDRLQRLLKFRGPYDDAEWRSYHPEGRRIFAAYAAGVNAFLEASAGNLPVEFKLTGVRPEPWTAEQLVGRARVSWAVSAAREELRLAMSVAQHGAEEAGRRAPTLPEDRLKVPNGLDPSIITEDVVAALDGSLDEDAARPELLPEFRAAVEAIASLDVGAPETWPGSNNWAIAPSRTATGRAIMVDDPHRQVTNPAHRHLIHLNAPGWDVVGATEPGLPGVIRGHNGRVAWGRTATTTDLADVYVELVNPANSDEVLFNGEWEPLRTVVEEIPVRGEAPRRVELKFSRHGPIFYEDRENHRAYALRSFLQDPGTAEYLGGLRLDQAADARACLTEANYMPTPPTNLVCADAEGNIAFRVAAFAPARNGWNGRLPVPGTGEYEWAPGRRFDLPSEFNPARGYIATANNNTQPPGFDPPYSYVPPGRRYWRYERIDDLLRAGGGFTVDDMVRVLNDSYNAAAAEDQALFRNWTSPDADVERARALVAGWDGRMNRESQAAAIYMAWRGSSDLPELRAASGAAQRALVGEGLRRAVDSLTSTQGADWSQWRWGRMNQSRFPHRLVSAYDLPAVERHGGSDMVDAIGGVYQLITDFSNLDNSRVIIAPGVSGQPGSPFYGNLLEMWSDNGYFPLPYTREAVEARTRYRLVLTPGAT